MESIHGLGRRHSSIAKITCLLFLFFENSHKVSTNDLIDKIDPGCSLSVQTLIRGMLLNILNTVKISPKNRAKIFPGKLVTAEMVPSFLFDDSRPMNPSTNKKREFGTDKH